MVAVVIPLPTGRELTRDEWVSLQQAEHVLARHDRILLAPTGMNVARPGFEVRRFAPMYFGSSAAHNRLLLSRDFYAAFEDYRFILIHHLDALALDDTLEAWCERDWDYIGAPWLDCPETSWLPDQWDRTTGVGTGGFSLRKVDSFLRVFNSTHRDLDPAEYWRRFCAGKPRSRQLVNVWRRWLKYLRVFNDVHWSAYRTRHNEDLFWSFEAVRFDPSFRVAPVEEALEFAWETEPERCFNLTGGRMPFGCHAWPRYDRAFWIPWLTEDSRERVAAESAVLSGEDPWGPAPGK